MTTITHFDQFIPLALRSESPVNSLYTNIDGLMAAIISFIASAEILDGFKKQIFYGKTTKLQEKINHYTNIINEANLILMNMPLENDSFNEELKVNNRVLHGLLGFMTESGELGMILDKILHGETIDRINLQEEVSDAMWYVAVIYDELNINFYNGLENVIDKLKIRFPDKFSSEHATVRNLDAERKELEKIKE
jgi:NTP pyrophosphatase (non-canonical NTP hydrolase)